VFARVSFVLSAKVLDPQFQGQIKERLNSRDAVRLVSPFAPGAGAVAQPARRLRQEAGRTGDQAGPAACARRRRSRRRTSGVAVLPGKLTDCESSDIAHRAVPGRGRLGRRLGQDGPRQGIPAILPLRGKVLNSWETGATACSPTTKSTTSRWPSASIRTA
jgi:topoisomerase-4 subunit B